MARLNEVRGESKGPNSITVQVSGQQFNSAKLQVGKSLRPLCFSMIDHNTQETLLLDLSITLFRDLQETAHRKTQRTRRRRGRRDMHLQFCRVELFCSSLSVVKISRAIQGNSTSKANESSSLITRDAWPLPVVSSTSRTSPFVNVRTSPSLAITSHVPVSTANR